MLDAICYNARETRVPVLRLGEIIMQARKLATPWRPGHIVVIATFIALLCVTAVPAVAGPATPAGPVLIVTLHYTNDEFSLLGIQAQTGYTTGTGSPIDPQDSYTLLLLDAAGRALATQQFAVGKVVWDAPILGEFEGHEQGQVMPATLEPAVIVPDLDDAVAFEIYDLNGNLKLRVDDLPAHIERQAMPAVPSAGEDISTPCCGISCLDILFLGDDYTTQASLDTFRSDVAFMANYFRQVAPFSSRPNLVNIRALPSTQDLQCNYGCFNNPRLICCNSTLVAIQASQVPHDKVVVLVNNETYGGSGSVNYATAYHRAPQYGPQVMIHEFAHSFALLGDEYSFGPYNGGGAPRANCDDNPACPRWFGQAGTSCIPGCTYDEWFRPTDDCLMLRIRTDPASGTFCPVCRTLLTETLDVFSDRWSDTNCDGTTDVLDITRVAQAWNDFVRLGVYDGNLDLDAAGAGDGDIDVIDVVLVTSRFGS